MARLDFFERDLALATADLEPAAIARELAAFARRAVGEAIDAGEAPPAYRRFVDGVEGAREEQVRPDGAILYEFAYWEDILDLAMTTAVAKSPSDSGRYKSAWFVMVDGVVWTGAYADIPPGAEVVLTNDQPYHRKLEMTVNADHWRGKARARLPAGIVEQVRQLVMARFGNLVRAEVRFIPLAGGYVLKGRQRRKAAQDRRSSAHRAGRTHLAGRKDTAAGQAMTYPAVVFTDRAG